VRRLFELLDKFAREDALGFQIIVTKHANLRNPWFQEAFVERPWTKGRLVADIAPANFTIQNKLETGMIPA
jgi:hypothetical protein